MAKKKNTEELSEETLVSEDNGEGYRALAEAETEEVEAENIEDNGEATVYLNGRPVRTYNLVDHGEDYRAAAESRARKIGGTVK